ncbi:MAG TPA: alkaline phosphatase family protein [Chloroflexia bacterium]|nr:alkaline phosphatase family protein [Chloroflexia bacterium]
MLNAESVRAVDASRWGDHFVRPLYDSYCFSRLPDLVHGLFSGEHADLRRMMLGPLDRQYDRVVLFFIDAFGWQFFERYAGRYPFLSRLLDEGYVTKLTSQFPSTTSAHITTIHTGMPVGESGVYEWFYYEPVLDAMITPLFFSYAGDREVGTLLRDGVKPLDLFPFPGRTVYNALAKVGVSSTVYGDRSYTPSPHSAVAYDGAEVVAYPDLAWALRHLAERLRADPGPHYYFLYHDVIDSAGHHHGPESPEFTDAVATTFEQIERELAPALAAGEGRTLFLMTADHGQVAMDPGTTIYIDLEIPGFERFIRTNRDGHLLVPGGSARDLFLYIKDDMLDEAHHVLLEHLEGKAEVHRIETLVSEGFFGREVSQRLMERVGNLVVLPYEGETVFWYGKGRFAQPFHGHHGGPTPTEMGTLLAALA